MCVLGGGGGGRGEAKILGSFFCISAKMFKCCYDVTKILLSFFLHKRDRRVDNYRVRVITSIRRGNAG